MGVAGVILCGGESRRMGRPKAWLPLGPECLLQRVVRIVGEVASPIVVVAAPDQVLPPLAPGPTVVRDAVPGEGPLRGLLTGLTALPHSAELAFAVSTDAPFLRPGWILRLEELIGDLDLAIPESEGRVHPLAALYRVRAAIPVIEDSLANGRFRLAALKDRLRTRTVPAAEFLSIDPELRSLRNLNTPEEYETALREAAIGPA
ncbi:molybdenum cofactor guanylyltransferase [Aquisphaera insulae]|uniref:molybdenum cofactor guanylyltransferase n=1 Tax=Aquisphaera insulae TaxID=2712864 RepID=UPI0013E9F661|nr:molybdenum cofactor guanylyltransferase [Aquisphaera insulae]